MIVFQWIVFVQSLFVGFFFFGFALSSRKENESRAAFASFFIFYIFLLFSMTVLIFTPLYMDAIFAILFFCFFILILLPVSKSTAVQITGERRKVDERDIMLARARYVKNSPKYEDYYKRHPELKKVDDALRAMPNLCDPAAIYYEPSSAINADSCFDFCNELSSMVSGEPALNKTDVDPTLISIKLTEMVESLGAVDVGMTKVDPAYVYSHVGRGAGQYGDEINLDHPNVIVFAVEMDYQIMQSAPEMPVVAESAQKYLLAANISVAVANYIRALGYKARAHIDGNYRIMLPPIAADAGLGEIGRIGYLIHPKYGARIRLGAISTDLPLRFTEQVQFGVQDFCRICKKCAKHCPSGAISHGKAKEVNGAVRWQTNQEACYKTWRFLGTDCGICMHVCPYSKSNSLPHRLIRFAIQRNPFASRLALWGDTLFYGEICNFCNSPAKSLISESKIVRTSRIT